MKLVEYRKKNSLRQQDIAQQIGCTPATVSRYESGRVPKLAVIRQIKQATGGAVAEDDWQEAAR